MDAALEKTYKKQLRISAILLAIAAILSMVFLVISIKKQVAADTVQK
jgi:hypothetical protein